MTYSLNEVESIAKRATRGAGYPWGIAEEAGRAVRWLHQNDLDGGELLVQLLDCDFASDLAQHSPTNISDTWQAASQVTSQIKWQATSQATSQIKTSSLCPLITGATLSDCARLITQKPVVIKKLMTPVLLIPFVANAARIIGCNLAIDCVGTMITSDGAQVSIAGTLPMQADRASIAVTSSNPHANVQRHRASLDDKVWQRLNYFADKTYAPATDASRMQGAGAGLSDND